MFESGAATVAVRERLVAPQFVVETLEMLNALLALETPERLPPLICA